MTQKLAFLGISGSGKTYAAGKLCEELLDAGAQVVVIDTIGNWWGLRLAPDGKGPGLAVPIIGGDKGDVPIEPAAGRHVAELVADTRASVVIDVSDFTGGELRRFVTDFATALLRLKKRAPSPVMVVWEECQDIVPQKVFGDTAAMVGAVERLIKKGRNYGVGTVLVSQRSAAVNKDVLNQIETLFCFRQNAAHDRKAIQDWIVHQSIDVGSLVDELPELATGTCFCWSPQWLKVLRKVRIAKKRTFDASATPEFGDEVRAGRLAPVDLEKFKKTMASVIEKAKANDPDHLRRRIAELEAAARGRQPGAARIETRIVEVPVVTEGILKAATAAADQLATAAAAVQKTTDALRAALTGARRPGAPVSSPPRPVPASRAGRATADQNTTPFKLDGGARRMLQQLAMRTPAPTTRTQLATLSGLSPNSGTYGTYLSQLNTAGFLEKCDTGGEVAFVATEAGLEHLGGDVPVTPRTVPELVELWSSKLDGRAKAMLRAIVGAGAVGLSRAELAEAVGLSENSGTYGTYLSSLNSNGLITKRAGRLFASALFTETS